MKSISIWKVFSTKKNKKIYLTIEFTSFVFEKELTMILTVLSIVPDVCKILFIEIINVDKQFKRPSSK